MKKGTSGKQVRKFCILLANFLLNNLLFYKFIGFLNRRFLFLIGVFVDYPASDFYTDYYYFRPFWRMIRWRPWISGVITLKGKLILKMSITNKQEEFTENGSKELLAQFHSRVERIKKALGAQESTFAGILPGVLYRRRIIKNRNASKVTAKLVHSSLYKLIFDLRLPKDITLINIGGAGFVGRELAKTLREDGIDFRVVDVNNQETNNWPSGFEKKGVLIINLLPTSLYLADYLNFFPPGSILLNEAYPPPEGELLRDIKRKKVKAFHICGARAGVTPHFPGCYAGNDKDTSIPCCAVPLVASDNLEPVIREM